MGKSFQDQLLALGLVDKKKANKAKKDRHQQKKKQGKTKQATPVIDENAVLAQKAAEKKKARAQKLNRQRDEKLRKRADEGRIRQLIEKHKVAQDEKGQPYRFNASGTIRRIFVDKETTNRLGNGQLGVVGFGSVFEVLPKEIIHKIQEIDGQLFVSIASPSGKNETDPDDPYAGFEVPDDLMW